MLHQDDEEDEQTDEAMFASLPAPHKRWLKQKIEESFELGKQQAQQSIFGGGKPKEVVMRTKYNGAGQVDRKITTVVTQPTQQTQQPTQSPFMTITDQPPRKRSRPALQWID